MPRTERWKTIQTIAAQQRATFPGRDTPRWQVALPTDSQDGGRSTEHCLRQLAAQGLDVFPLPPGDPLLGGARAVFDREFVAYDAGLPPPAVAFSLAHELGHALLHGGQARCSAADIDEECTALAPASPVAVETYSPRQQRELEANAFAAAFLMPPAELRAGFLAGLRYTDLAARYGVSESAMLNTLAAVLLGPPPAVVSRQSSVVSNESVGSLQDAVGRDDAVSGPGPAERAGDEGQGSDRPQSKIHDEGLGVGGRGLGDDDGGRDAGAARLQSKIDGEGLGVGGWGSEDESRSAAPAVLNPKSKIQNPKSQESPKNSQPPTPNAQPPALDLSQAAAATIDAGPVLIDAGPGTGKTRTLIERVLYLLRTGVPPGAILALTFSNRAAQEMRERLRVAAPGAAEEITVGTFHAFCLQFLQEHATLAGLPLGVMLVDDVQAATWLESRLAEMRLLHYSTLWEPARYLPEILGAISRARDELVDAAGYARLAAAAAAAAPADDAAAQERAERWAEVARAYAVYEQVLDARGALDFGGLLLRTVELLRARPALLARQQQRYRHLLVDEYQDMNRASGVLLQLLAGTGQGLWVVGDLRQAIYRFRGASPANINQFESDFPGGRRLRLGVNYRSDPAIVALFATLGTAMPLPGAAAATWAAQRPPHEGPRIWLAEAGDGEAEARGILAEIQRRQAAGRPLQEQAILCRTHGQAASIARVLEAAGVPTLYLGNLFERPEIRDLLALVSLAAESDGRALLRASRLAGAPIDRLACAALVQWARAQQVPFPRALDRAAEAGLEPAAAAACAALAAAIDAAGPYRDPAGFLARFLFGPASPLGGLLADGSAGAAAQIMAIDQLLGLARSLEAPSAPPPAGTSPDTAPSPLRQFLTHVRRLYAAKQVPGRTPAGGDELAAVRVLTVHASKGLEFPVVYVPCLAAGRFPFREMWEACPPPPGLITGESESDQELEETCLFFVALSRARDELVLSRATRYGKQAAKPSPFLALLAPAFAQQPPQPLTWPAAGAPAAAAPAADSPAPDPETVFDVADLEQYLHCPRQYEYSRRLRLDAGESGGYQSFNKVVREVLRHLRAEHTANRLPAGEAAVLELLAGNWESAGPQGHIHEALYADAARRLVLATWRRLAGTAPTAAWREELTVPLGGATVRARLDLAQRQPGQGIRVVRLRTGKPRDDDRRALRLALIQAAARQELGPTAPLTIELEYLETGETVPVEIAGRYERERLAKLEGAVQGIRAGHFPATPADADACLRCPFWIICPA